ncbi:MAG: hypothetical protein AB1758_27940, partial [Candidatus Eremiobacterota bacterium]
LEDTLVRSRGRRAVPPEVAPSRNIPEHLEEIYRDLDATLGHFRHPAAMLGQVQHKRKLAVLHIIAEDVLRQVGPERLGQTFTLPADPNAGPIRARFLGRPLEFYGSGLFNRPAGMWEGWKRALGEPTRFVVIPHTTHGFEQPGRAQATKESVDWIRQYLCPQQAGAEGR